MNFKNILDSIPSPTIETYSYSAAKDFSRELDHRLGLQVEQVENWILNQENHTPWAGLDPQALQTPYPEIRMMLNLLVHSGVLSGVTQVVDLGAGYGRMGLVIGNFFPSFQFTGYEISKARVDEGNRVLSLFSNARLICEDISRSEWKLPEAQVYFIYDFGDLESIMRVIDRLKERARHQRMIIVGRGRRTRDHIERHEPWLSQVNPPEHCGNFSIYRS